jgi:hypothetical protein
MENSNGGRGVRGRVRRTVSKGNNLLRSAALKNIPKCVLISWLDACHEFGWQEGNDDIKSEVVPCVTIGWLLGESDESIKVCQTWTVDNHAQTIVIPKGMVLYVTEVNAFGDNGDSIKTQSKNK